MGQVAYKLDLPQDSLLHPVFHVSQLKLQVSPSLFTSPSLPIVNNEGQIIAQPQHVMATRNLRRRQVTIQQMHIQWSLLHPLDSTWEDCQAIQAHYPAFYSCGQECSHAPGIVMPNINHHV